jgi:endonuclease III
MNNTHVAIIRNNRPAIAQAMRDSVRMHGTYVAAELDAIAQLDATDRARHAIVFSIVSPRCPFNKNVKVTPVLVNAIMSGERNAHTFTAILSAHGIGLQNQKGKNIASCAELIATMSDVTRALCMSIRGIALKASAMTLALYDQHAEVYTLDTHMLRELCKLAGIAFDGSITDAAYRELETFMIDIARTECPDVSIFLTQWSLWNTFKNETHESHTAIFGL